MMRPSALLVLGSVLIGCDHADRQATAAVDSVGSWGKPTVLAREEGESRMLQGRRPLFLKIDSLTTGSRTLTVGLEDLPPGDSIGVHKHLGEDEFVFVHRGAVEVTLGDAHHSAQAGAIVFIPRGTWIGFRVLGPDTATIVFAFNTPGFEKCLRILSSPAGEPFVRPADSVLAAARLECHHVRKADVTPPATARR